MFAAVVDCGNGGLVRMTDPLATLFLAERRRSAGRTVLKKKYVK